MDKKIILLGGTISSGKNFCYDIIESLLGSENVHREYFARELKDTCKEVFSRYVVHLNQSVESVQDIIDEEGLNNYDKASEILRNLLIKDHNWYEDKTDSTRILLQTIGTDLVKNKIDNDYWVKCAAQEVLDTDKEFIVFTDLRYVDEYLGLIEQCNARKGFTVNYRYYPISISRDSNTKSTIAEHASENGLVDFRQWYGHIDNNGSVSYTKEQIEMLLHSIKQD